MASRNANKTGDHPKACRPIRETEDFHLNSNAVMSSVFLDYMAKIFAYFDLHLELPATANYR